MNIPDITAVPGTNAQLASVPTRGSSGKANKLVAVELAEDGGPATRHDVARAVAEAVGRAVEELTPSDLEEAAAGKVARFRSTIMQATETALGALEGTLKAKSLEGALKDAQIVLAYAEVRERTACAAKADAETEEINQRIAFSRIKETLALYRELGIEVRPVALPDGRLGIAIGDGLVRPIPGL